MPSHCCVPQCTARDVHGEDGEKLSFFTFPSDKTLKKKWIHAIRREEGPNFKVRKTTVVCGRHFRESDIKRTLAGKNMLKPGVVPSLFAWVRTSPRKRNPPKVRLFSIDKRTERQTEKEPAQDMTIEEREEQAFIDEIEPTSVDFGTQTDYTPYEEHLRETIQTLNQKIEDLTLKVSHLERKNNELKSKLFSLENIQNMKDSSAFYTGFSNWDSFMAIYNYLDPGELGENINYWLSSNTNTEIFYYSDDSGQSEEINLKKGRSRTLKPLDEYFLVLCRLRQGFHEDHLAHLFHISPSTVSRIIITWINYMFLKLGTINIWPTREDVDANMPESFKEKYKSTRVIIDCTEVKCQMPSSLQKNSELFSSYKNHTTLKGLVGISPGGAITFVSQLYTGSISDREIVERSGFLDMTFDEKDSVMADKGFTIQDLLPLGVSLNLPPFLGASAQMDAENVILTQEIASLRIHIERAINKIKNFHVWDRVVPLHQFGIVNQMWAACAILCNAQPNIISI